MRIILRLLLLLIMVFCFSCEEQGLFVKCDDCTSYEPVKTKLEIKLDIGFNGKTTFIKVYEGNLEDSVLYTSYSAAGTRTTIPVSLNKKYTVTATYYILDNRYITVDSATPRVKYDKERCDDPCYFVYDREINIRLKYY